ncbi:MAG: hypothetical protein HY832_02545 [Candidatus Aenigmarchaeota archaeon]|nr:hypothetical protein [Candidatus Aenigmarchaeota archaeon]
MATPTLDVGFLSYFSPVFIWILIFTLTYAMMQFTKFLGENKIIHAGVGLIIATVFLFSTSAASVVMFIAPWFTVLFIFAVFLLMAYKLFGATDDQIKSALANQSSIQYTILALGIIILLFGLGAGFGQNLLGYTSDSTSVSAAIEGGQALNEAGTGSTATSSFQQNLVATLFNPKVLGMLLILIIGAFTIRGMTGIMTDEGSSGGGSGHH